MEKEPKNWSEHPAYQPEDLEIKNGEELEEAKEIAGVSKSREEILERQESFEKWLKKLDGLLGAENFKPQKAEWVDDEHIEILFKKGNETAIFDVKIERGLGRTWCDISYPSRGDSSSSSFTMTNKSVDEVLREIEHKFGVTVPPKK